MPVKFIPRQIAVEKREIWIRVSIWAAVPMFIALSLGDYAVYEWIRGNPGNTIIFGLIAFGFIILSLMVPAIRLAQHDVDLKHAPDKVKFWSDIEAYESNFKSMDELVHDHGAEFLRILKVWDGYVRMRQPQHPEQEEYTPADSHTGFAADEPRKSSPVGVRKGL